MQFRFTRAYINFKLHSGPCNYLYLTTYNLLTMVINVLSRFHRFCEVNRHRADELFALDSAKLFPKDDLYMSLRS